NCKSAYSKSGHFYFGETGHFYFGVTLEIRIRCIMLILGKFKNLYAMVYSIFFDFLSFRLIRNSQ
ncbi:hypothetical protein, partial [Acinetobacter indicus]|uniref:hypothetical protein n=1 Tax=Acinetobacter indicus TaxID=756892 RepID=UPI001C09DAB1